MPPRITPVVEDLASQEMAPDAPFMGAALRREMVPPGLKVVEIEDLPGEMVQPDGPAGAQGAREKERMVIGGLLPLVAPGEDGDRHAGRQIDPI